MIIDRTFASAKFAVLEEASAAAVRTATERRPSTRALKDVDLGPRKSELLTTGGANVEDGGGTADVDVDDERDERGRESAVGESDSKCTFRPFVLRTKVSTTCWCSECRQHSLCSADLIVLTRVSNSSTLVTSLLTADGTCTCDGTNGQAYAPP